jgi:Ca-activated chloride channel family protein
MRFENPHVLWLLLVLPALLLLFLWWAGRRRQQLLSRFIEARLLPQLTAGISPAREKARALLLAAAAACLLVAIARPQWGFSWEEAHQRGLDIVMAIDTSKSMLAEDIKPNRLARAKLAAEDLMQIANADRLGLVAFAGTAFLQCPLTFDDAAFRQSVESLDTATLPQGGTAIATAITTAQTAFKEGDNHRILVLFTDGEDHDPNALEAARKAAESGMRIFTIGIGSAEGELLQVRDEHGQLEYIKDEDGNVVKSHLNEPLLQEIAKTGNGFYLPLRGARVMDILYEKGLAPLPKTESAAKLYRRYHEQFLWPLGLAIVLLIVENLLPARRRESRAGRARLMKAAPGVAAQVLIIVLLLLPGTGLASTSGALRDYKDGNFGMAQAEYQRLMAKHSDDPRLALNAGTAAYRVGKFDEADSLLSKAVNAPDLKVQQEAYYNRGSARFMTGDAATEMEARKSAWEKSLKDFEGATKLDPKDADAKYNYEFVKQKLEELKQQEQPQQQQQQQKQDKKDQKQDQKNQQQKQDQTQQNQQEQQKSEEQKQRDQQQQQQQQQQPSQDQQKKDQQQQQQAEQDQQEQASKKPDQQSQGQQEKKESGNQQQEQQAAAQQENQMSQEEAKRILDSTKNDEQMLPVQTGRPPQTDRKFKDW